MKLAKMKKAFLNKRRGATSVLVILMLVVLVALGSFAITSANVNIKFSNQAIDWNTVYYDLDSLGENFVMEYDAKLSIAEQKSIDYILSRSYDNLSHGELPYELHLVVHYMMSDGISDDKLNEALNMVYLHFAEKELNNITTNYPNAITSTLNDSDITTAIATEIVFSHPENNEKNLTVVLYVNELHYQFEIGSGGINTLRTADLRYKVDTWQEWQVSNLSDYENGDELWDGSVIFTD